MPPSLFIDVRPSRRVSFLKQYQLCRLSQTFKSKHSHVVNSKKKLLPQYLHPGLLFLMTDSIRRGIFEVRFSQYSRDISKTHTRLTASINYGIELGCFAESLFLMCCHVFSLGFMQGALPGQGRTRTVALDNSCPGITCTCHSPVFLLFSDYV